MKSLQSISPLVLNFVFSQAKNQYTSTKYQLNSKFQYSMTETCLEFRISVIVIYL